MNNYALSRFKISQIMSELAKREPAPRIENIFRLAAKVIYKEFDELKSTEIIHESMGFFLRECKHPVNRAIFEAGVENLTSSSVIEFYINDSEFFSKKANALQSLIFIKEAMQHHAVFADICILDVLESHFRNVDVYVPAVMNDLFKILNIPHSTHTSLVLARSNTEFLFLK
jgi:hypothetical protein